MQGGPIVIRLVTIAPYVVAAAVSGLSVWWVMALRSDNAALTAQNAALTRDVMIYQSIARANAHARDVAREEAQRQAERASDYDAVRAALIDGDFDAPLPPDFCAALRGILPNVRCAAGSDRP